MANEMVYNDTVSEFINDSDISMNQNDLNWLPNRKFTLQIWPFHVQVGVAVLCGLLTLLTVTGNLVVLFSYATTKKLRTYANHFIFGLALVDLTDGIIVLPLFSANWIMGFWPFSQQFCEVFKFFNHMTSMTSYYLTLVICIDRYCALSQPLKHLQQRSTFRAASMMSVAFLIPLIFCIGALIIWPIVVKKPPLHPLLCVTRYNNKYLALSVSFLIAWMPLLLICILYLLVVLILKQRRGIEKQSINQQPSFNKSKAISDNDAINKLDRPSSSNDIVRNRESAHKAGLVNLAFTTSGTADETGNSATTEKKNNMHRGDTDKSFKNKIDQQTIKATRILSLIVVVMFTTRLPWSLYSVYYFFNRCGPACLPKNLVQVSQKYIKTDMLHPLAKIGHIYAFFLHHKEK